MEWQQEELYYDFHKPKKASFQEAQQIASWKLGRGMGV